MTATNSTRYREMRRGITRLRNLLLPSKFNATGLYSPRVHQKTAAFRLLAHAEFESYLEDVSLQHLQSKLDTWKVSRTPSHTLSCLLAYDSIAEKQPTSILTPPQKPAPDFEERLAQAAKRFNAAVRVHNHGIREANILGILLPIGVSVDDIDLNWLQSVDSWGKDRGEIAHKPAQKISTQIDPAREYQNVKELADGFKGIDILIRKIN